ncbi:MAG: Clp protease ClpP [Geobacteraceae bacterium]|nr:Clp protease ClpP [Geobacteraceae bacterium]
MKNITISGVIGWDATAADLRDSLKEANGEDVEITISSPGGFVSDGLEMFNLIRNYAGNTTARLTGYAMSMASYIPLAATRIVAEDNAVYMIHNVRGGVFGDHNDILNYGATTKGMSKLIAKAYAKRTGKSMAEVERMMDVETYLFGEEMVDHGFIDEIITTEAEKDPETARAMACVALQNCNGRMSADISAVKQDLAAASRLLTAMGTEPTKPEKKEPPMANTEAITIEVNAAAIEAAKQEGAAAERQRVAECRAIPVIGHQALVDSMIDEGKTASEIALAIVSAENSLRVAAAAALVAEASPVVPVVDADSGDQQTTMKRADFNALTLAEQREALKTHKIVA